MVLFIVGVQWIIQVCPSIPEYTFTTPGYQLTQSMYIILSMGEGHHMHYLSNTWFCIKVGEVILSLISFLTDTLVTVHFLVSLGTRPLSCPCRGPRALVHSNLNNPHNTYIHIYYIHNYINIYIYIYIHIYNTYI